MPAEPRPIEPRTVSVKLRTDVVRSARIVCAVEGNLTLTDLLSDILKPVVAKMEEEALAKRSSMPTSRPGPSKGKKQSS